MRNSIKKIVKILGVDTVDESTIAFMGEDLMPIKNEINNFVAYVRNNCNSSRLNFKDGYQKFILLIDDYKKMRIALTPKEQMQLNIYIDELTSKVEIIFEQYNEELYKNGVTPFSESGKKYLHCKSVTKEMCSYLVVGRTEGTKGLKVVDCIGRENICRIVKHCKHTLKDEIEKNIKFLVKQKKEISLGYKTKSLELENRNVKRIGR